MENTNGFGDIVEVLGGNKDFQVSLDYKSVAILSIALSIAILIGVSLGLKIGKL